MGSKAFAFYFPSMEPYLLSEASEDDSDIINALANTLQIRLKQDPQSIKGCLVPALRNSRLYIGKYAKIQCGSYYIR